MSERVEPFQSPPSESQFADAMEAGRQLIRDGALEEAAAHFTSLLVEHPSAAAAHFHLGAILARRNRMQDALAALTLAAYLEPANAAYFFHLARCCHALGHFRLAECAYSRTLQLKPEHEAARVGHAEAQAQLQAALAGVWRQFEAARDQRDYSALVTAAHEIERLNADHPAPQFVLADADERSGRIQQSFARILRMTQLLPGTEPFQGRLQRLQQAHGTEFTLHYWQRLAERDLRAGRLETALLAAEKARHTAPDRGEVCLWHAAVQEKAGKTRAAQSAYTAAQADPETQNRATAALARLRKQDLVRRRTQAGSHLRAALELRHAGEFEAALASLAQAEPALRDDPLLFLLKATIHQRRGNLQQAVLCAETAVKLDLTNPTTNRALDDLRRARDEELSSRVAEYLDSGTEYLCSQEFPRAQSAFELARERWEERWAQITHPLRPLEGEDVAASLRQQEVEVFRGCIYAALATGATRHAAELAAKLQEAQPENEAVQQLCGLTGTLVEHDFNQAVVWGRIAALLQQDTPTDLTPAGAAHT